MNGPDHYREAERLLDEQVYATLALAAATALYGTGHGPETGQYGTGQAVSSS